MDKSAYRINIVGAGVSGLIAAINLEQAGYHPVIIESSDRPGGRVKTDIVEGYPLDHGFQVLLSGYPLAKKYLNYEELELVNFLPGAQLFYQGHASILGDPLRDLTFLFPTLFSSVATIRDKWKILQLQRQLQKKEIHQIFEEKETTTAAFLKNYGFSDQIIEQFFKPFFTGIFLEPELHTSSRKFKFVYKMFGEGYAAIPKKGMEAIVQQLVDKLQHTTFRYNTTVQQVEDQKVVIATGEEIESHFTIIATEPSYVLPNLKNQEIQWKSCDTLYFETRNRFHQQHLIGLVADKDAFINTVCHCIPVNLDPTETNSNLISVTIVKSHTLHEKELIERVTSDLKQFCNIEVSRFVRRYVIKKGLPDLANIQYEMMPSETRITTGIFIAGDQQLNGSLNAAMVSGERAAQGVIETLEQGLRIAELTSEYN